MKYYYTDKTTAELLESKKERVYLYGGFVGYNNFGDIIQLKYAINFHKMKTQLEPVVVLHLSSLESSKHIEDLKKWYRVDNFIFISDSVLDASDAKLQPLKKIRSGGLLHIYGGGYLNKYWGKGIIEKIDDMISQLSIGEYLFSGQQVEKATIPILNNLFSKKEPVAFGVRDMDSYEWMGADSTLKKVDFSFDDVTEIFEAWLNSATVGSKLKVQNKLRPKSTLWHINISSYATSNKLKILEKIRRIKRDYPEKRVIVAHAYNDIRLSLRDSLQSILQLENEFPYYEYKVLNLAQMALDIHPEEGHYPNIANILSTVDMSVASSYHTAMLTTVFGIPSFLMSENEFYSQKRKALGFGNDFGKFVENPDSHLNDFTKEKNLRSNWLQKLEEVSMPSQKESNSDLTEVHSNINIGEAEKLKYRQPES